MASGSSSSKDVSCQTDSNSNQDEKLKGIFCFSVSETEGGNKSTQIYPYNCSCVPRFQSDPRDFILLSWGIVNRIFRDVERLTVKTAFRVEFTEADKKAGEGVQRFVKELFAFSSDPVPQYIQGLPGSMEFSLTINKLLVWGLSTHRIVLIDEHCPQCVTFIPKMFPDRVISFSPDWIEEDGSYYDEFISRGEGFTGNAIGLLSSLFT